MPQMIATNTKKTKNPTVRKSVDPNVYCHKQLSSTSASVSFRGAAEGVQRMKHDLSRAGRRVWGGGTVQCRLATKHITPAVVTARKKHVPTKRKHHV